MSTGLIIVIVVAAILIIALLMLLPRMRANARHKQAQRELHSRRERVADEHRGAAAEREQNAEAAEREARIAERTAERERAQANLEAERAQQHERGMADHELIDEHERDKFEGVTGTPADADRPPARDEGRFDRGEDVRESERRP